MISFFRKIRRGLLTDNKFSRYLVYAAGEIVLVVIGILIALQFNNFNETRKKEKTAIEILKQIQEDIITSVDFADWVLATYREKDSLAYLVLSEKVTSNDYLSNRGLVNLVTNYAPFHITDYGFKKLDQYLEYTYPYDMDGRLSDIKRSIKERQLDGLIHYTQMFCYRQIYDIIIRNELSIPVLTLEGDRPDKLDGRTSLRIETFVEMLKERKREFRHA